MQWWRGLAGKQLPQRILQNAERIAHHKYALGAVFLLELAGSTIIPLPMALIMVALVSAAPKKWARFAAGATLGSVAGGLVLYVIGRAFFSTAGQSLINYYGSEEGWTRVVGWFHSEWGLALVVLAGVTTGLFRVASLAAGFTTMNPAVFLLILLLSRVARWFAECYAIKYVNGRVRTWPKSYLKYATVATMAVVLVTLLVVTIVI